MATGFDDIRFPLGISMGSTAGPEFSTEVTELASGFEVRNRNWAGARLRFNVAPGVRSLADYETLLAFFYARAGRARGFRFRDWSDWRSGSVKAAVSPTDQVIGTGDDAEQFFQLTKTYASGPIHHARRISRPVAGTVRIALGGIEQTQGWEVDPALGLITFDTPPPADVAVSAGFEFDVPVRFDIDRLEATAPAPQMMQLCDIPIVEIRE
ncbi:uncharacterized protein (TIGR02217 family) [Rhodothalassium salexigens DSM 2132]|uniref:Uncharacterized protein (TIGR02217 family) n=1 Tax=Rhodothalassium salexigens DSM 2132 TaxID=1188247 RepID=A0A4R2P6F6_RHOSA|nr:DUF2460 domain-containing protein [Rhodothalassium salexigens]MBB4212679.1 uncharacterized protein (TIGR02217 family) [Rhodothalassium salexigens DSM 2132]MBK1637987.1 hypothetical protein [Rhodothalassium salexigens DSM 2132]TCP30432.1 uncharacterized protein (TIGR02217 family) [Rhodothalassium salexigens DSM 2132]